MMELTNIKASRSLETRNKRKKRSSGSSRGTRRASARPVRSDGHREAVSKRSFARTSSGLFLLRSSLVCTSVFLFVYYKFILFAQWDRTMIFFAFVVGFACLFQIVLCWKELRKGFQARLQRNRSQGQPTQSFV